ncbi:MAG: alpha/beta hydrolase [Candidatus Rifleibacteriota bacterium]
MFKSALFLLILIIAQPSFAQNNQPVDGGELQNRFLRFQQMRKNMPILERIKKFREFRAKRQNSSPQAPKMHLDLAYGNHERQKLDIYAPENASGSPVLVYIHGGAWKMGNKKMVNDKPVFFTSRNWIFVSANYRLLPEGRHPNNAQDVASALAWVHDNIEKFGGNPDRIILCGFSAGAHLAALVGLDGNYLSNSGKSLSVIKTVVLLDNPVSDVLEELKGQSHDRMIEAFGDSREIQINASPARHASSSGEKPVFIIAHSGGMPSYSPMSDKDFKLQADLLATALEKSEAKAYIFPHLNLNHTELDRNFASFNDQAGVTAPIMNLLENF